MGMHDIGSVLDGQSWRFALVLKVSTSTRNFKFICDGGLQITNGSMVQWFNGSTVQRPEVNGISGYL